MIKFFRLLIVLGICLVSFSVQASENKGEKGFCAISSAGQDYIVRDCVITTEKSENMEFTYIERADKKALLEEITLISITQLAPETAEISGLTTDGINSRWGEAAFDGKCWIGSDFLIFYSK